MEDQTKVASGAIDEGSAQVESGKQSENSVSFETHSRLVGQRKKDQEELRALRDEKAARELKEQEEAGNYKDVISSLRGKLETVTKEKEETTKKVAYDKFASQCQSVAKDMGCADNELLMMLMTKERMASVELDDKLNANTDDLKRVLTEIKEQKPLLFGGSTVNHTPMNLAGFKKSEPKKVAEMSKDELKQWAANNL